MDLERFTYRLLHPEHLTTEYAEGINRQEDCEWHFNINNINYDVGFTFDDLEGRYIDFGVNNTHIMFTGSLELEGDFFDNSYDVDENSIMFNSELPYNHFQWIMVTKYLNQLANPVMRDFRDIFTDIKQRIGLEWVETIDNDHPDWNKKYVLNNITITQSFNDPDFVLSIEQPLHSCEITFGQNQAPAYFVDLILDYFNFAP